MRQVESSLKEAVSPETIHLLAVDDDKRLRTLLSRYLKDSGFRVSTVANITEAEKALSLLQFDLIILDIMMPGRSGLTFLENPPLAALPPVILLTAQSRIEERIQADDYLVKPFDPRELLLRIQSILKRTQKKRPAFLSVLLFSIKAKHSCEGRRGHCSHIE